MPGYIGKKENLGNVLGKKSTSVRATRMGRKSSSTSRRTGNMGGGVGTSGAIANMQARSASTAKVQEMMRRFGAGRR
jgi:hypothetical protein